MRALAGVSCRTRAGGGGVRRTAPRGVLVKRWPASVGVHVPVGAESVVRRPEASW
ncbi:hypothetical protein [Kribbella swartbergensis]